VLKVKLVRSRYGHNPSQRKTIAALGLHKIRQEKSFEDTPAVRGMIKKVEHLVEVTES
jgi:large subunit ribosomal protein L30